MSKRTMATAMVNGKRAEDYEDFLLAVACGERKPPKSPVNKVRPSLGTGWGWTDPKTGKLFIVHRP